MELSVAHSPWRLSLHSPAEATSVRVSRGAAEVQQAAESRAISVAQARSAERLSWEGEVAQRSRGAARQEARMAWKNPRKVEEQRSEDAPTEFPSHPQARVRSCPLHYLLRVLSAGRGDRWAA